jgi:signal transduction histidine kinase
MIQFHWNLDRKPFVLVGLTVFLFACFIFFCGLTHLVMPLSLYSERVRLVFLDICCVVSIATAIAATYVFPVLLKITDTLELTKGGMLQQMQSRLMDVIKGCQESIVIMTHDWVIITANQSTANIFGDDMHVPLLSLVHIEDKDILKAGFESVLMLELTRAHKLANPPSATRVQSRVIPLSQDEDELSGMESSTLIPTADTHPYHSGRPQVCVEYRVQDREGMWTWIESTLMLYCDGDGLEGVHGGSLFDPIAGGSRSKFNLMMMSRNVNDKKKRLRQEKELSSLIEMENMAKLKYITCCAHDLKTPLQSFNFAVDLLEASGLQTDQLDILQQARVSSLLLSMTISQTMDTSKVMMGGRLNPRKATIQLSEIVSRVAIVIESYSKQVPIYFHLESGIINNIVTDQEWLWQMLLNYLTNACKYTESGAIDVEVKRWSTLPKPGKAMYLGAESSYSQVARDGDFLLFQIIDSGIGISDQHVSTLFHIFGQSQVGQSTGTGMGLYGVKIRAEAIGGHCGVLSRERHDGKQGSVFWFMIPYVADTTCYSTFAVTNSDTRPADTSYGVMDLAYPKHYSAPANLFQKIESSGEFLHLLLHLESSVERPITIIQKLKDTSVVQFTTKSIDALFAVEIIGEAMFFPFTAFVVDDVPMIRKLMLRTLKQLGFTRIELFENGSKALEALKEEEVDFVFMDMQMPVMSGPEVSSIDVYHVCTDAVFMSVAVHLVSIVLAVSGC